MSCEEAKQMWLVQRVAGEGAEGSVRAADNLILVQAPTSSVWHRS